jgi:lipoprotein signal peptidase
VYLLLAIPAVYGMFLVVQEHKTVRYSIFLGIFLAYLALEWLLDYVLKINFRENWKQNWKWVVPYLSLYYAMNYGFVVMPWKTSLLWGLVMLGLLVVQIITNLRSHPKMSG